MESVHIVACPACVAAPSAEHLVELAPVRQARLMLSLRSAHCAGCISIVEVAMKACPGVHSARVNLTQKRVSVEAVGFEAHELLSTTETDRQGRVLLMRLGVAFFAMMYIVLLGRNMAPMGDAARIARQATRRMGENFATSAAYNVTAVPLALMRSATPLAVALALAMSRSSITVSLNALSLW